MKFTILLIILKVIATSIPQSLDELITEAPTRLIRKQNSIKNSEILNGVTIPNQINGLSDISIGRMGNAKRIATQLNQEKVDQEDNLFKESLEGVSFGRNGNARKIAAQFTGNQE